MKAVMAEEYAMVHINKVYIAALPRWMQEILTESKEVKLKLKDGIVEITGETLAINALGKYPSLGKTVLYNKNTKFVMGILPGIHQILTGNNNFVDSYASNNLTDRDGNKYG